MQSLIGKSCAACLAALMCVAAHAGLVEIVAAAKPSIAAIGTYSATQNPRFAFRGTGFTVGNGNLMVTNAHVLPDIDAAGDPGKTQLVIQIPRGKDAQEIRPATLVSIDRDHDIALLRFEGAPLPALELAATGSVHDGLSIAFIGFPIGGVLGFTPVTHRGIVSAVTAVAKPAPAARQLDNKTIMRLRQGSFDIYQLDATAYPGNSGGPVLDVDNGKVIGIINMVLVKGTKESALSQPTGISYAVPAEFARKLIEAQ
ncbi:MAG: serine protease [Caldimonas sp.]